MSALHKSGIWEIVLVHADKFVVDFHWVYAVKIGPDGQVDRLKVRLVSNGYTQIFGLDYSNTFAPVAKITSIRQFLSTVVFRH